MATRSVNTDIAQLGYRLRQLTDTQLRYAVAGALTEAVKATRDQLKQELPRYIDRPTRWTINAAYATFARASNLTAEVGLRSDGSNAAGRYLQPLIRGTRPEVKGADRSASRLANASPSAVLVPSRGGVPLNQFGNVSLSNYAKIIGGARAKQAGLYVAPVKAGSTVKAIFQRKEGFIPRTSTLETSVRRLFTIDPSPRVRTPRLPLDRLLNDGITQSFPGALRTRFNAELRRAGFR